MPFQDIPDDVIFCILPLLKLAEAIALGNTCRRMRGLMVSLFSAPKGLTPELDPPLEATGTCFPVPLAPQWS
jgi:hypothetical protein